MKLETILNEKISTEQLVNDGKLKKIEFYATSELANRLVEFLNRLGNYTAMGCSRTIGIFDDSDAKDIKIFIDGDGSDRIRDAKVVTSPKNT